MIQSAIDLFDGERSHPCRRQLDGERDPIEPMADRNERLSVLVGDPKVRAEASFEQRNYQRSGTGHRGEQRTRAARQLLSIPGDLELARARTDRVAKSRR